MSDTDQEELHDTGCSNSMSEQPVLSKVDSTTQQLGVNACSPIFVPKNQESISGLCLHPPPTILTPYKCNLMGNVPSEKVESCNGGKFIETPTPNNPQRNTPPTLSCYRGWAMVRGRGQPRVVAKISTVTYMGKTTQSLRRLNIGVQRLSVVSKSSTVLFINLTASLNPDQMNETEQ